MPCQRMCCTTVVVVILGCAAASGQERLADLPDPIRAYAAQFAPHCRAMGRPGVITNEMYSNSLFGAPDINHDGKPDYIEYKCMFGCEGAPFAFAGVGQPCPFGALLLSSSDTGYRAISIPGTITQFDMGPPLTIAVTRWRIHRNDCDGLECRYLFELREGRFQLVTPCPPDGCKLHLSGQE